MRAVLSCFGLLVLGWIFLGFLFSGAMFFGGRALERAIDEEAARAEKRDSARSEYEAELRRQNEQRRAGVRIDARSGRPMQRARPMVDVGG